MLVTPICFPRSSSTLLMPRRATRVVGPLVGQNREDLEIGSTDGCAHNRCSTGITGLEIAGQQSRIQCRRSANEDGFSINIVLSEKSLFPSEIGPKEASPARSSLQNQTQFLSVLATA